MNTRSAKILLASIFIARGTSFLFSKSLMLDMSPLSILAVRFILAFFILAIIFNKKLRTCTKGSLVGGTILGVLNAICMVFEMYGLKGVDTGVAAVIENMAIIFVPIYIAIWTRTLPKRKTLICAVVAVLGVACLSLSQTTSTGFNFYIILTIMAALIYGGCIIMTDKVAKEGDPITIGTLQIGVMGVVSLILSLCTGTFQMPTSARNWEMILMLILVCTCFGFTFQPLCQKFLPAETAAMYSVMNPLTSSLMGFFIAHEDYGILKVVGCVVILVDLVIYNIESPIRKK